MPSSKSSTTKVKVPRKKPTSRKISANLLSDKGKRKRTLLTNEQIEDWLNNKLKTFDLNMKPISKSSPLPQPPKPPSVDDLSSRSSDLLSLSKKSSVGNKSPDQFPSDPSLILNQFAMIQQGLTLNQDADPDVILVESQLREATQNALYKVEWIHPNVPYFNKSVKYLGIESKVTYDGCEGVVKYLGSHPDTSKEDVWLGIELDELYGLNDGQVNGKRLFDTKPGHGVFTRAMKVHYRGVNAVWLLPEYLQPISTLIPHDDYNLEVLQRLLLGETLPTRRNWTKKIPNVKERKFIAKRSRKLFGLTEKETLRSLTLKYTMAKPLLSTSFNVNKFSVNEMLKAQNSAFPIKEVNASLKEVKSSSLKKPGNSGMLNKAKKSVSKPEIKKSPEIKRSNKVKKSSSKAERKLTPLNKAKKFVSKLESLAKLSTSKPGISKPTISKPTISKPGISKPAISKPTTKPSTAGKTTKKLSKSKSLTRSPKADKTPKTAKKTESLTNSPSGDKIVKKFGSKSDLHSKSPFAGKFEIKSTSKTDTLAKSSFTGKTAKKSVKSERFAKTETGEKSIKKSSKSAIRAIFQPGSDRKKKVDPEEVKAKKEIRKKLLSNLKNFRETLIEEKKKMLAWISIKAGAERARGLETARQMQLEELSLKAKGKEVNRARRQQRRLYADNLN